MEYFSIVFKNFTLLTNYSTALPLHFINFLGFCTLICHTRKTIDRILTPHTISYCIFYVMLTNTYLVLDEFWYLSYKIIIIVYDKQIKVVEYQISINKHYIENTVFKCIKRQNGNHSLNSLMYSTSYFLKIPLSFICKMKVVDNYNFLILYTRKNVNVLNY